MSAELSRTPQAGEFGACGASNEFLIGPSVGCSDYSNAVEQFAQPSVRQTHYKRPYAGMLLRRRPLFSRVEKVRAHVKDSDDLAYYGLFCKRGNDAADHAAKQGAAPHPRPTPDELQEVERLTSTARMVCKLAYSLLPLWPKLDLTDVPWVSKPEPAAKEVAQSVAHQYGSGKLPQVALGFQERDHRVMGLECSNDAFLYVCTRCYGYTCGGQFKKLRADCKTEVEGSL
eukprot:4238451-Pyramimonas_sp.AAC.1